MHPLSNLSPPLLPYPSPFSEMYEGNMFILMTNISSILTVYNCKENMFESCLIKWVSNVYFLLLYYCMYNSYNILIQCESNLFQSLHTKLYYYIHVHIHLYKYIVIILYSCIYLSIKIQIYNIIFMYIFLCINKTDL